MKKKSKEVPGAGESYRCGRRSGDAAMEEEEGGAENAPWEFQAGVIGGTGLMY